MNEEKANKKNGQTDRQDFGIQESTMAGIIARLAFFYGLTTTKGETRHLPGRCCC